jgi:hypothetical protein
VFEEELSGGMMPKYMGKGLEWKMVWEGVRSDVYMSEAYSVIATETRKGRLS